MKLEKMLVKAAALSPALAEKPAAAKNAFEGKWTNQYGSTAELKVTGSAVSGTYTSVVSSSGATISGPISGFAAQDIIGFTVLWPTAAKSMTSWVGQIVDEGGKPTLRTLWHLIIDEPDASEPTGLWQTVYAGSDQFW